MNFFETVTEQLQLENAEKADIPILYMTIGVPGCGKSTIINYIKENYFPIQNNGLEIIASDDLRKELLGGINNHHNIDYMLGEAFNRILNVLWDEKDVIFDATNVDSELRNNFIEQFIEMDWTSFHLVYILFLNEDIESLHKRIRKDVCNGKDRSNVPFSIMEYMLEKLKITKNELRKYKWFPIDENKDIRLVFPTEFVTIKQNNQYKS